MSKALALAAVSLLMVTAMLLPSDASEGAQSDIVGGKRLFSPGEVLESGADDGIYLISDGSVKDAYSKIVDSKGNTVSSASVSPSTTSFGSGFEKKGLKVTVPSAAGDYRLQVEFRSVGGSFVRSYPIKVVDPITLSADLRNDSNVDVSVTVQFVIDGTGMEVLPEHENVRIQAGKTKTLSYDWITDSASRGKHTYRLAVTPEDSMVGLDLAGAGTERTFYVCQTDHTWLAAIFAVLFVILLIVMLWVYRKPVKNFGKPKGRR